MPSYKLVSSYSYKHQLLGLTVQELGNNGHLLLAFTSLARDGEQTNEFLGLLIRCFDGVAGGQR